MNDKPIRDVNLDDLEEQRDQQFLVKITGPQGTPVYYHASLKDDGYNTTALNENYWVVDLKSSSNNSNNNSQNNNNHQSTSKNDTAILFNSIEKLEFRLGGKVVKRFQMNRIICRILSNFDEERQMGSAIIEDRLTNHPSIAYFIAFIGSIPMCTSRAEYLTQGIPFLQNYLAETIRSSNANESIADLDKNMIITQLFFERSEINGIMSLLKNIGVDTSRETPPLPLPPIVVAAVPKTPPPHPRHHSPTTHMAATTPFTPADTAT
mmetsp:Transcript_67477/g.75584  ORF Transcript_67477/g.75584 Transcript_67477/m.75584 type:complete len:265 (+) Transcript_67477:93-887(+)